jgi:hypothetical protein
MALGFTQSLIKNEYPKQKKMLLWNGERPARKADNLNAICELDNMGSLTSHNPIGLHGLLRG